ncbi:MULTISPECIES: ABC transporter permease [unclassified Leptolyngbya]|uniref:ABC transporter permease n=1 Tax=unclassified Leptolyngbya TaxID=2650499 RepID=UPI0016863868|nr:MULTISPECIES: ABC transporter permease [unclassified Leptolyngbya]MBD1912785.1 ABC transporter permease [Leptolyngbya sp. FACHB-8]MBD2157732.1 ABC transporter permease [Leptolyngbya sp. FACHB-16]
MRKRSLTFYLLAAFFGLFVLFLYGPMISIFILSFQGPEGGLTFPMRGFSPTYWLLQVFQEQRVGNFVEAFWRSLALGLVVTLLSLIVSVMAGLAFRSRFKGSGVLFYLTIASLIVPSILISLGIGIVFQILKLETNWFSSGLGAHLTWTVPFAFLIVLGIFNRFNPSYEEAARDLGAGDVVTFWDVIFPLIAPSLLGIGILAFTLSYDEFTRTSLISGQNSTLPLEIFGMTTNVTSPALYALGTLTTLFSFALIIIALVAYNALNKQQKT